jgi:integrase
LPEPDVAKAEAYFERALTVAREQQAKSYGLRAGEIGKLTWPMLIEPTGEMGTSLELQDRAAKKGSGRVIPVHPELRAALVKLAHLTLPMDGPVIRSERGGPMIGRRRGYR